MKNAPPAASPPPPAGQLWLFLATLCLFSALAATLRIHVDAQNTMLDRFTMWVPAIATLITCRVHGIDLRTLGWQWPGARWLRFAWLLPVLYALPVYLVTWFTVPNAFALDRFMAASAAAYELAGSEVLATFGVGLPLLLTIGLISGLTWALGEELGWRGFLFPRLLARFGFHGACLAGGLIWAVWHYPGLIWGDYNAGTNPVFAVACFTLTVVAMSYILGWVRLNSQSIWPAVLLHASHNLFIQAVFDPMTANTGPARYITTEFGAGLTVTIAIAALIVVRTRPVWAAGGSGDALNNARGKLPTC